MKPDAIFPTKFGPTWGKTQRGERAIAIVFSIVTLWLLTICVIAWPGGPANGVLFAPSPFRGASITQMGTIVFTGILGFGFSLPALAYWGIVRNWRYYAAKHYIKDVRAHHFPLPDNATLAQRVRDTYGGKLRLEGGDPANPSCRSPDATITASDDQPGTYVIEPGLTLVLYSDTAVAAGANLLLPHDTST